MTHPLDIVIDERDRSGHLSTELTQLAALAAARVTRCIKTG